MTETILAFATPAVVQNARRAPIEVEPLVLDEHVPELIAA